MSKGIERERQVKKFLEGEGWWVCRAAGSLGDADLVACRAPFYSSLEEHPRPEVRLIEVKATAAGPYAGFLPDDRARLLVAAELAGAQAWLAWWAPHKKLRWIHSSDWPKPKAKKTCPS